MQFFEHANTFSKVMGIPFSAQKHRTTMSHSMMIISKRAFDAPSENEESKGPQSPFV